MRRRFLFISVLTFAVLTSIPVHAGENQFIGLFTGATLGSIVGNQFGHGSGRVAATMGGALAGGWIGNDVGQSIDNNRAARQSDGSYSSSSGAATYQPTHYVPNYVAPDAPSPDSIYDSAYGSDCRSYAQQIRVGNRIQKTYGTACLQADGTWRAVE